MEELRILALVALVAAIALASARLRMLPLVALILAACLFGLATGTDITWIARNVHLGFSQALGAAGFAIVVGIVLRHLAEENGALAFLRARLTAVSSRIAMGLAALAAGFGGNPVSALAVLAPVLALAQAGRRRAALRAGGVVTAIQGALVPTPLPIAGMTILGADWRLMLALGLPMALAGLLAGWALTRHPPEPAPGTAREPITPAAPSGLAAIGLGLALIALLAMLILNALGQIPSEPLGSANARERILRLGLPMLLLLAGAGIVLAFGGLRHARAAITDETGSIARGLVAASGILFTIGAAGGLQMVIHTDGIANLVIERVLALPASLGLAVPFMIAFIGRAVHGSPLTAAITAAGLVLPILGPLGLEDETGRAMAALAVSAGAIGAPLVTSGYFWLACHQAGLAAHQGLRWISLIASAQALAMLAMLLVFKFISR